MEPINPKQEDNVILKAVERGVAACDSWEDLYAFLHGAVPRVLDTSLPAYERMAAVALLHAYCVYRGDSPVCGNLAHAKAAMTRALGQLNRDAVLMGMPVAGAA